MKERLISELTSDNKRYRAEIATNKAKIFQLEADIDFLRATIEQNLPFFNSLEEANRTLKV